MTRQQYIAYLIATTDNYACNHLADHLDGGVGTSHDAVSDYLRREKLTERGLFEVVAPLLDDSPGAYLIVDDSVQDKRYSRKIELVRLQYSGAVHGLVRGIGVINLLHVSADEKDFYPIDYRIYDPDGDGKTKNDHFREMLIRAKSDKQIQARTLLFDAWYASVDNLKSNRLVSLSKETGFTHLQTIDWTAEQLNTGILVKLKDLPFLVRLFKIVSPNADVEWLIANRSTMPSNGGSQGDGQRPITAQDVQHAHAVRWKIEQLHQELKQLVETEKCQARKARSQRNHLACCYQAWLSLKIAAKQAGVTLYAARTSLFRDYTGTQMRQPKTAAYVY